MAERACNENGAARNAKPKPKASGSCTPSSSARARKNSFGSEVSRPAPSPLAPSASTPPRCVSRSRAVSAKSTMSCAGGAPRRATNPVPHASWSGWPQLGCRDILGYRGTNVSKYNAEFQCGKLIFCRGISPANRSKLGYFAEIKIVDFHGGHDHFESLFAGGANRRAEHLHIAQRFQQRLVKAEITHRGGNFAFLHKE